MDKWYSGTLWAWSFPTFVLQVRKNPEKNSPMRLVPTEDWTRARCVTDAYASASSTAVWRCSNCCKIRLQFFKMDFDSFSLPCSTKNVLEKSLSRSLPPSLALSVYMYVCLLPVLQSPNEASKPINQWRWNSITKILFATFFFHFLSTLKIKGSLHNKKFKISIISKMALVSIAHTLWNSLSCSIENVYTFLIGLFKA